MHLPMLFHWSPADRFERIRAEGLVLEAPNTVAGGPLPYLCLSSDPQEAWYLSGAMDWVADHDRWDLWGVTIEASDEVRPRPTFGPRIVEFNVHNPLPPGRLWYVGRRDRITRHNPPPTGVSLP